MEKAATKIALFAEKSKDVLRKGSEMSDKNPLHGITLNQILTELVEHYGFEAMGDHIDIKCFTTDPSISSSLKFLRRTEWARKKVENMYLDYQYSKTKK